MAYQFVLFDRSEGVGLVTLNRPEQLNAFTLQMLEELLNVFKGMERDPEVRAIILTGAGKAFCGGEDFKARAQQETQAFESAPAPVAPPAYSYNPQPIVPPLPVTNPDYTPLNPGPPPSFQRSEPQDPFAPVYSQNPAPKAPETAVSTRPNSMHDLIRRSYSPLLLQIRRIRKPVIAAINGVAAGTGFGLALACDVRYASDNARFLEVSTRVGLMPGGGLAYLLPRLIGTSRAMELAFAGEEMTAGEARDLGLVSKVVTPESLLDEARKLALRLAKGPTRSIGLTKALMNESSQLSFEQALNMEAQLMEESSRTQDYREGLKAFLEKRAPNFKGS
ncbi:MAG: enoyl-CoA hydratase [Chloroflexi bacterium]|uniref:Enoyl-CoA hydratase n=1 Tax=Candidatus Chlorohelix allophototropha TaxID=3003348 RepID=A0A8T7M359_9CHLR|nr:enoyl-CoA hydratase [Chloroflexota bacterium]WJW67257.1 enoyl-CoA hydratase [Chloroflexota bacterium L227-S17]